MNESTTAGYKLTGFVLRLNEDRLSGLRFIFGFLIDRSGAKGSSHSVGTWNGEGRVCKDANNNCNIV